MSSPRRAAKEALERAAKAARGSRPAVPPLKASAKSAAADAKRLAARREAGEQLPPVARNSLTATYVMVTASGLLRAADLAAFELGMWQGWTGL